MTDTRTAAEMLVELNDLRTKLGKSTIAIWKASRLALQQAIQKNVDELARKALEQIKRDEAPKVDEFEAPAEEIAQQTIRPKQDEEPAPVVEAPKPAKAKKAKTKPATRSSDLASWCKANNVNPKVARAKLRKAKVAKVDGSYPMTADVIALLKPKAK
jgi:hypothetical protein